jgi:DNA-binding CsgD family transcriptional regulator
VTLGGDVSPEGFLASLPLTLRQLQVLQLAVDGRTTKEIARELSISARTAEGHLAALRSLADIRTVHGLTALAVAAGLAWPSQLGPPRWCRQ